MNILRAGGVLGAVIGLAIGSYNPSPPAEEAPPEETAPAVTVYLLSEASSTGDPNSLLSTPIVASGNRLERVVFQLQTPGTARVPNATDIGGAYVEWLIRDIHDNVTSVDQLDVSMLIAWLNDIGGLLPIDTYLAVAATAGGVAGIANSGVVVGIRYNASGNEAFFQSNAGAGAGWSVIGGTSIGTPDLLTRGVALKTLISNSNTAAFRQVIPLDAAGYRSSTSGSSPAALAANVFTKGSFTHMALVAGHSGTTGAASKTVTASARSYVGGLETFVDYEPTLDLDPFVAPSIIRRVLEYGDSNTNSTTIDAVKGVNPGNIIPSGWTVRTSGVNQATYETTASPGVGKVPWFIDYTITFPGHEAVDGTRWYARRGINGSDANWPGTMAAQFSGGVADVAALGGGPPDAVVWNFGANDISLANNATLGPRFLRNMRRNVRLAIDLWPLAVQILVRERTNDPTAYPGFATVDAAFAALVAEYPGRVRIVSGVTLNAGLFDQIHFSTGSAGGQRTIARAILDTIHAG